MNPNELQEMMQRAQEMQSKVGALQADLAGRSYEASAGGGMVTATVSGALRVLSIRIEASLAADDDRTMIQDLTAAAVNAALAKAQDSANAEMQKMQTAMLSGLSGLPGMPGSGG